MGRLIGGDELDQIRRHGQGLILNRDNGVLHRVDCDWVERMTLGTRKEFFESLVEARSTLEPRWGPEGGRWRRCPICIPSLSGGGRSAPQQTVPPRPAPLSKVSDAAHYVIRGPTDGRPVIEAWSDGYIPYEPHEDWQRYLRRELRDRLATLKGSPDQILHAIFSGAKLANADVENALIFNIDDTGRAFQPAAFRGLMFEHSPDPPVSARSGEAHTCQFTYRLVKRDAAFSAWTLGRELASWSPVDVAGPCSRSLRTVSERDNGSRQIAIAFSSGFRTFSRRGLAADRSTSNARRESTMSKATAERGLWE